MPIGALHCKAAWLKVGSLSRPGWTGVCVVVRASASWCRLLAFLQGGKGSTRRDLWAGDTWAPSRGTTLSDPVQCSPPELPPVKTAAQGPGEARKMTATLLNKALSPPYPACLPHTQAQARQKTRHTKAH